MIRRVCPPFTRWQTHIEKLNIFAETAVPFSAFKESGFDVHFATEKGNVPKCDDRMLYGLTGKLLVRSDSDYSVIRS